MESLTITEKQLR